MSTRRESEYFEQPLPSVGAASSSVGADALAMADTAAVLWVPDPDTRRGWREYWVERPRPGARPMGFQRPGVRR